MHACLAKSKVIVSCVNLPLLYFILFFFSLCFTISSAFCGFIPADDVVRCFTFRSLVCGSFIVGRHDIRRSSGIGGRCVRKSCSAGSLLAKRLGEDQRSTQSFGYAISSDGRVCRSWSNRIDFTASVMGGISSLRCSIGSGVRVGLGRLVIDRLGWLAELWCSVIIFRCRDDRLG